MACIDLRLCGDQISHHRRDATAYDVGHGRRDSLVGDVLNADAGHETEQLHRHVGLAADAGGSVNEFSRLRFRGDEEVLDRFDRMTGVDEQNARRIDQLADRDEVAQDVVLHVAVGRGDDRDSARRDQQRVSIVRCAGRYLDADHPCGAGTILDVELLADGLRQPIGQSARGNIGAAAGLGRNDDAHRARGIARF